jgi:hypothetical protein
MISSADERFRKTEKIVYRSQETLGVWLKPTFLTEEVPEKYISTYVVPTNHNGRPDLISQELYGTPFLDWVLISFNGVYNTLNWPPTGLQIKYPSPSIIRAGI